LAIVYAIWHALSTPPDATWLHAIPSCIMTCVISGQHLASFAQVGAPPSPPVAPPPSSPVAPDEPPLDPPELLDPPLEPLEEVLDPLDPPELDPLDPPEDPLADPLDPPEDPLEEPPSLSVDASSPRPPVLPPFAAQAASNTSALPDTHPNTPIFSIDVSSSLLAERPPTRTC
jgi:hypothetical protein